MIQHKKTDLESIAELNVEWTFWDPADYDAEHSPIIEHTFSHKVREIFDSQIISAISSVVEHDEKPLKLEIEGKRTKVTCKIHLIYEKDNKTQKKLLYSRDEYYTHDEKGVSHTHKYYSGIFSEMSFFRCEW